VTTGTTIDGRALALNGAVTLDTNTITAPIPALIPALTITKTADTRSAAPDGTVHYTITVTDTGQTAYAGATLTDSLTGVLGDATCDDDATATAGAASFISPDLTWTGDLATGAHLAEVYGAEVSKQTITAITDRVMEGLAEWQSRPLDPVYAVVFIDAINVKIREGQVANRPVYLALGVTADGERDVLGLWAGEHGDGEGAKYWLRVLSEIKNRGVRDVCMLVCDGLKGLPDAVSASGRRPSSKHVSCTFCGIHSSTPRSATGRRSRKTSSPFTPPRPNPRRWTGSPNSPGNGRSATRLSYGSGRTRGPNSCRSSARPGNKDRDLHDKCHRVHKCQAQESRERPRPLPDRAGSHEVPVPGDHEPGPDREGPQAVDEPVEGRPERFRHNV
jgi:uncharacterized repeat protein (TIGR01451 family)